MLLRWCVTSVRRLVTLSDSVPTCEEFIQPGLWLTVTESSYSAVAGGFIQHSSCTQLSHSVLSVPPSPGLTIVTRGDLITPARRGEEGVISFTIMNNTLRHDLWPVIYLSVKNSTLVSLLYFSVPCIPGCVSIVRCPVKFILSSLFLCDLIHYLRIILYFWALRYKTNRAHENTNLILVF